MSQTHEYKQDCLNRLNKALLSLNQRTYTSIQEVDLDYLNNLRRSTSNQINSQFTQKNAMIAGYCNNIWIKTLYNGIYFNITYSAIPYLFHKADEEKRAEITKFLTKYSYLIRIGIFGLSYLFSRLSNYILDKMVKYGVRLVDHMLGACVDNDSINKQWIGAIIMALLTTRLSPFSGLVGIYDGFRVYKGYKEQSQFFQKDVRELQTSIDLITKFK